MAQQPVPDNYIAAAHEALRKYGSKAKAAKALGLSLSTYLHRLKMPLPETNVGQLKLRIDTLEKDLKAATKEQADTKALKELIGTAALKLDTLELPAWVVKAASVDSPGVPTLQLSDFHWGERVFPKQVNNVNEYTVAIARDRLKYCIETAIHLCQSS